jgi:hypothetical protein
MSSRSRLSRRRVMDQTAAGSGWRLPRKVAISDQHACTEPN